MAGSHCTGQGQGAGPGTRLGTMGYYILCRTVHTALGPETGPDPLSPIVSVPFPVPAVPFPCSVNVLLDSCVVCAFLVASPVVLFISVNWTRLIRFSLNSKTTFSSISSTSSI